MRPGVSRRPRRPSAGVGRTESGRVAEPSAPMVRARPASAREAMRGLRHETMHDIHLALRITRAALAGAMSGNRVRPARPRRWHGDADDENPTPTTRTTRRPVASPSYRTIRSKAQDDKKFRDFNEVIKGTEKIDGLFTLHHKDDHLYAEIKNHQFDQPLLAPIAIARGMEMAGQPLNFGDEWVLVFKHVGDRVQLIRRNVHFKAPSGSPLEKAVKQNYTDSVLMALPIVSINHSAGQSVVIDLGDIFFTDFAELGFGHLDRSRTNWHKIKAFPNNIELEVEATFGGGGRYFFFGGDDGVADSRGRTLVIHYSLAKLPDSGYKVRHADDRVGHFLNTTRDFGLNDPDTNMVRMVNRWRIEKSDPKAKLSPPKKQLIWYVESNVPHEYRPFVEAGILEWNKAFEKIGIRNALAVRWQEDGRDEFDPEDINYCTFRWITTSMTYAMSCLRSNPLTGEMIDGDVIFDASWIKYWKMEYAFLTGAIAAAERRGDRRLEPRWPSARDHQPDPGGKEGSACRDPLPPRGGEARSLRRIGTGHGGSAEGPSWSPRAGTTSRSSSVGGRRAGCSTRASSAPECAPSSPGRRAQGSDARRPKDDKPDDKDGKKDGER